MQEFSFDQIEEFHARAIQARSARGEIPARCWLFYAPASNKDARWAREVEPRRWLFWRNGKEATEAHDEAIHVGDTVFVFAGKRRTKQEKQSDDNGPIGQLVAIGVIGAPMPPYIWDKDKLCKRRAVVIAQTFSDDAVTRHDIEKALGPDIFKGRGGIRPLDEKDVQRLLSLIPWMMSGHIISQLPIALGVADNILSSAETIDLALARYAELSLVDELPRPSSTSERLETSTHIDFQPDDAELDRDRLGRGVLAVAFAQTLHGIWCRLNGFAPRGDAATSEETDTRVSRLDTRGAFVVHLDAPWGGGKTTFANFVARVLNPSLIEGTPEFLPDRLQGSIDGLLLGDPRDAQAFADKVRGLRRGARRPWIVTQFNAWQHQHVDPPWWCFYQSIREQCFAAIRDEGRPLLISKDDDTRGGIPKIIAHREHPAFRRLDHWYLVFREFLWRFLNPKVVKLVLAGIVAFGIVYILWCSGILKPGKGGSAELNPAKLLGLSFGVLTGVGSFIWAGATVFIESLVPGTDSLAERLNLGAGDPFERFRRHFRNTIARLKRPVLVVVDDLDRCEPEFVVGLIRGMQTILRSPRVVFLVLGGRNWLETAFEAHHAAMKDINVGSAHSFGGRFVEKAFQLSFLLPGISEQRETYLAGLLAVPPTGRQSGEDEAPPPGGAAAQTTSTSGEAGKAPPEVERYHADFSDAATPAAIEAKRRQLEESAGDDETLHQAIREEAVMRLTSLEDVVQQFIGHLILPLAKHLPSNPRQIKRITNMISLYQRMALLHEGMTLGDERWRKLVLWVTLLAEWPAVCRTLVGDPSLADDLHANPEVSDRTSTPNQRDRDLKALRDNPAVLGLLHNEDLTDIDGVRQTTMITKADIIWLRRLIPIE